jgi:hypothetical protein
MDRKLNCFFQIDTVVADSVASFELCEELGRPTSLEIDVRFASAITSENALGLSAFAVFGDDFFVGLGLPSGSGRIVTAAVLLVGRCGSPRVEGGT